MVHFSRNKISWKVCIILFCTSFVASGQDRSNDKADHEEDTSPESVKKPCCLPYKFQAVVVDVQSFHYSKKQTSRLYRDWESKIQVMEGITYTENGVETSLYRAILDYKNKLRYDVVGGKCSSPPVRLLSGMLEPCMPDDALYLGNSYIGAYDDKAEFEAWYFQRTDQNRAIEMTIAVTRDHCVPVMEHITGTIEQSQTNNLVLFTNVTDVHDDSVFTIPENCIDQISM